MRILRRQKNTEQPASAAKAAPTEAPAQEPKDRPANEARASGCDGSEPEKSAPTGQPESLGRPESSAAESHQGDAGYEDEIGKIDYDKLHAVVVVATIVKVLRVQADNEKEALQMAEDFMSDQLSDFDSCRVTARPAGQTSQKERMRMN